MALPPHDLIAEQRLLGAVLTTGGQALLEVEELNAEEMYRPQHGVILRLARELAAAGANVDPVTVAERLEATGMLEECGGAFFLLDLCQECPYVPHCSDYVAIIKEKASRRKLLQQAQSLRDDASDPTKSIDEIVVRHGIDLPDYRGNEPFIFESVYDLMAGDHTIRYLIDGMIPEGQPGTYSGPSKGLKTSLMLAAMISLNTGRKHLGRYSIPKVRRCGMMSAESGKASIVDTLRRQLDAEGLVPADLDSIFSDAVPQITDPTHIRALDRLIRRERLEVLFCDPYYMMSASDDPYNLGKQGAILKDLGSLCQNTGCTIVLAHHLNKTGSREQSPDLTHLNGSGLEQFVRWWILISRTEPYDAENGFHKLRLSIGGSAGHSDCLAVDVREGRRTDLGGRVWQLTARSESEARQDAQQAREFEQRSHEAEKLQEDCEKFIRALVRHPEGATARTIRDETGLHSRRVPEVLAALEAERRIVPCTVTGSNKRSYPGFTCRADGSPIGPSDRTGPNALWSTLDQRSNGTGPLDHWTTPPIGGRESGPMIQWSDPVPSRDGTVEEFAEIKDPF